MGKALYRTHRSTTFDEVIGQDHIVQVLKNMLAANKVSHAYLMTGPRGVGKTSVARILAYGVNGIDYDKGGSHLDIIEIDAASNRRIDEIREIRERVMIAPTSGKYKVYIIDEVHMLTREAFNALLKTLEEPPDHAIFILATTDLHKVPETIISRCIRLTFNPISIEIIAKHLASIAKKEKINIDKEALELIAEHANGGFRDAITLLEQVSHQKELITESDVRSLLGLASKQQVNDVIAAVEKADISQAEHALQGLYDSGAQEAIIAQQLIQSIREKIIGGLGNVRVSGMLELQRNLLEVAGSVRPRVALELAIFSYISSVREDTERVHPQATSNSPDPEPISQKNDSVNTQKAEVTTKDLKKEIIPPVDKHPVEVSSEGAHWPAVLDSVRKRNNTLYAIARMAEVHETDSNIRLVFTFPFHYKQMQESKNRSLFSSVLKEVSSSGKELQIELASANEKTEKQESSKTNIDLSSVSNIFGSHEVLES